MTAAFVGVDGGGTRSRAVVLGPDGRELGRLEGPPALVRQTTLDDSAGVVAALVRDALAAAGATTPATGLVAGLAGSGRPELRARLTNAIAEAAVARSVEIVTDADVAFFDAFGSGAGIILIAGTGSMARGRTADGRVARAGGWGERLGDEGSGWAVGLAGVQAVARAADGRAAATDLAPRLLAALGLASPDELIGWAASASKAQVAALAPVVVAAADAGDTVAAEIVGRAVRELTDAVEAVRRGLEPWSSTPAVALTGGLVAPGGPLRSRVETGLAELPVTVNPRPVDPARGAARQALETADESTPRTAPPG